MGFALLGGRDGTGLLMVYSSHGVVGKVLMISSISDSSTGVK